MKRAVYIIYMKRPVCVCVFIHIYTDTSANEDNSFRNHIR